MASRVIIPRMGQTMTEGTVTEFYVKDGDTVKVGDAIYELEYDKSNATIEAKAAGIVRLLCEEGDVVPLGKAVAVILENGERLEDVNVEGEHQVANAAKGDAALQASVKEAPKMEIPKEEPKATNGKVLASPLARKLAKDSNLNLADIKASKADGVIRAADVNAFVPTKAVEHNCEECHKCSGILATPLARKLAKEAGIDLADVTPKDGVRIYKEDILAFVEASKATIAKPVKKGEDRREKLTGMRKVIAERMTQSYFTYPTVTLTTTAEMTEFMKMRSQLNDKLAARGVKLSVTDLLVMVVAKALAENEVINTTLDGNEIVYHSHVNVGIAVSLEKGLVVPVVRDADLLGFEGIAKETKRLIKAARDGKLSGDEMQGGTFSITNLGMYGIDTFNPIINYPQSAILGVGRTVDVLKMKDGQPYEAHEISLSLTHDHRVIDGTPAAAFLKTIVDYIEKPFTLFL